MHKYESAAEQAGLSCWACRCVVRSLADHDEFDVRVSLQLTLHL